MCIAPRRVAARAVEVSPVGAGSCPIRGRPDFCSGTGSAFTLDTLGPGPPPPPLAASSERTTRRSSFGSSGTIPHRRCRGPGSAMAWSHVRRTQGHRPRQGSIHPHDRGDRPAHAAAGAADRPHPRPRPPEHLRHRGPAGRRGRAHPHPRGRDLLVRLAGLDRPGLDLGGGRRDHRRAAVRRADAHRGRRRRDLAGPVRHRP